LYEVAMRLDDARLCLDCEEIHDERECPACGSEAYAFLKRWIKTTGNGSERRHEVVHAAPAPPGPTVRQPPTGDQLDVWRRIVEGRPAPPGKGKLVVRGLVGLAAMGLAGWAWTRTGPAGRAGPAGRTGLAGRSGRTGRTGLAGQDDDAENE
jgi:hypothetical protein